MSEGHDIVAWDDGHHQRAANVGFAMGVDILINYPLWIASKRMGAGLPPFPSHAHHIYKGAGSLYLSLGPTAIIEDRITHFLSEQFKDYRFGHPMSSACSGVVAACTVTSQVEHIITWAHAKHLTVLQAVQNRIKAGDYQGLFLPKGMAMMCCREIPFAISLFYARPWLTLQVHERSEHYSNPLISSRIFMEFCCGVLTSLVSTPVSHPFAVLAAQQQGHDMSLGQAWNAVTKDHGLRGLFRGIVPRAATLAGTFTVVPLVLNSLPSSS